jgi:hypothetical protein
MTNKKSEFTAPAKEHIEYLAGHLRASDRKEIELGSGLEPLECLRRAVKGNLECKVWLVAGKPVLVYGVAADKSVWLLGTDDIRRHKIEFMRQAKKILKEITAKYAPLYNFIWQDSAGAKKWLTALGARFGGRKYITKTGAVFEYFEFGRADSHY